MALIFLHVPVVPAEVSHHHTGRLLENENPSTCLYVYSVYAINTYHMFCIGDSSEGDTGMAWLAFTGPCL